MLRYLIVHFFFSLNYNFKVFFVRLKYNFFKIIILDPSTSFKHTNENTVKAGKQKKALMDLVEMRIRFYTSRFLYPVNVKRLW